MSDGYFPPSDFLQACIDGDVTLGGSRFGDANLARLIAMTRDADVVNRDWATMLLAQTGLDTTEVRAALVDRVADADAVVRGEALLGLAERDAAFTLPLVAKALGEGDANVPLFEAAEAIGDPALLPILLPWRDERSEPSDPVDEALEAAILACGGTSPG